MKPAALFGLTALFPAAFSPAPAAQGTLAINLCTGDGQAHMLTIALTQGVPAPGGQTPCCAKGCRNGGLRKRSIGKI